MSTEELELVISPEDWPQTEMEKFEAIDGLGGVMFWYNHDAADGRVPEDPKMDEWCQKAKATQERIAAELEAEFGVILPQCYPKHGEDGELPPAPVGKTYWGEWLQKMRNERNARDWNNSVCSACPFGHGEDIDVRFCYPFHGNMRLPADKCGLETFGDLTERGWPYMTIADMIGDLHGNEAKGKFIAKQQEIQAVLNRYRFWYLIARFADPSNQGTKFTTVMKASSEAGPDFTALVDANIIDHIKAGNPQAIQQALAALRELKPLLPSAIQTYHETIKAYKALATPQNDMV